MVSLLLMSKLSFVLKTVVDEECDEAFRRRAARAGCNTAELLRDIVYELEFGMTHGEYIAKSRREAISRRGRIEAGESSE